MFVCARSSGTINMKRLRITSVIQLSVLPGHISTEKSVATCVPVWTFSVKVVITISYCESNEIFLFALYHLYEILDGERWRNVKNI